MSQMSATHGQQCQFCVVLQKTQGSGVETISLPYVIAYRVVLKLSGGCRELRVNAAT